MDGIGERIRHRESLDKVMTAAQAAELIEDGMTVATTGNPLMGYPRRSGNMRETAP